MNMDVAANRDPYNDAVAGNPVFESAIPPTVAPMAFPRLKAI